MAKVAAEVGSTVNNYEILGKLATGGMAEIFLAKGASAGGVERYVVLKRILRSKATDAALVRMFLDEARLAAQLQHANIAQVFDIGKLGDSYFFTMEYVHGETVRSMLHRANGTRTPVPLGVALTIAAGAASGLHYAHEKKSMDGKWLGIVHRDVSPSNLMVSYDGTVKVVDFGVAKASNRVTETNSGTVKGKISYLAPEQIKGGVIDRRTDLFSFGIVLWEMLTCKRLYRRPTDFESMAAIVNEAPPAPSTVRSDIPPELDAMTLKLLAKNQDERFQSAADLQEALEAAAIKAGSVMSTPPVVRFLRELFGQRPEPWINTEMSEVAEGVTVTMSSAVAEELGLRELEDADVKLEHVPDWSHRPSIEAEAYESWSAPAPAASTPDPGTATAVLSLKARATPAAVPVAPMKHTPSAPVAVPKALAQTPSAPAPVVRSGPSPFEIDSAVTIPADRASPLAATAALAPAPVPAPAKSLDPATTLIGTGAPSTTPFVPAARPTPPPTPEPTPSAGFSSAVATGSGGAFPSQPTGSAPAFPAQPTGSAPAHTVTGTPPPMIAEPQRPVAPAAWLPGADSDDVPSLKSPRRPLVIGGVAAGALVLILIIYAATRGGGDDDSAGAVPADAADVALGGGSSESIDAAEAVAIPVDAAEVVAVPIDAAQVAAVAIDAAEVIAVPVDAQVAAVPVDAAVAPGPDKNPGTVRKPKPDPGAEIAAAMKSASYGEVVSKCSAAPKLNSDGWTLCVLAACKTKDTARAKKWFRGARREVIGACKQAGIELEAKRTNPGSNCGADLLGCQK